MVKGGPLGPWVLEVYSQWILPWLRLSLPEEGPGQSGSGGLLLEEWPGEPGVGSSLLEGGMVSLGWAHHF